MTPSDGRQIFDGISVRQFSWPNDAFAIAGQVKRRARLPSGVEDRGYSPAPASRPSIERKNGVSFEIPRASRGWGLRVIGALEAQEVFTPILRGDAD